MPPPQAAGGGLGAAPRRQEAPRPGVPGGAGADSAGGGAGTCPAAPTPRRPHVTPPAAADHARRRAPIGRRLAHPRRPLARAPPAPAPAGPALNGERGRRGKSRQRQRSAPGTERVGQLRALAMLNFGVPLRPAAAAVRARCFEGVWGARGGEGVLGGAGDGGAAGERPRAGPRCQAGAALPPCLQEGRDGAGRGARRQK